MKRTENISLAANPVIIDADAYKLLNDYLQKIDDKFNKDELSELKKDVEVRVLELLYEQGWKPAMSISAEQISKVIGQIGEIEADDQDEQEASTKLDKKLFRDPKNGQILGICQGLGEYFNVDPVWIRLSLIILLFLTGGAIVPIYIFAGIIIPEVKTEFDRARMRGNPQNLDSIISSFNDKGKAQEFLKKTNLILQKIAKITLKIVIIGVNIGLQIIRLLSLALAIFTLFGSMIFIWSESYQKELNIFLTPLNLSEKVGFSLLILGIVSLLILLFLATTKIINIGKQRYKFKLSPALFTILALIIIQLPPAIVWGRNFSNRNQSWDLMSEKYFSRVQYSHSLPQDNLNIEANGNFAYSIEFSDDDRFSLEANVYKSLADDFKLETISQNETKLTSPSYTKVLQAKEDICLTCSQARFSPEDGSFVGLIQIRIPRTLKTIQITNNQTDYTHNSQFVVSPEVLSAGLISGIDNGSTDYDTSQFIIINKETNETIYPKFMTGQDTQILY